MQFSNPEHQAAYERIKAEREKQATTPTNQPSTGKTAYEAWMTESKIVPADE